MVSSKWTSQINYVVFIVHLEFTFFSSHPPQISETNTEISCFKMREQNPSGLYLNTHIHIYVCVCVT